MTPDDDKSLELFKGKYFIKDKFNNVVESTISFIFRH